MIYTDEDLNPHNHRRWLYVLIHLSATFHLNDINSTPLACEFKSSKVYNGWIIIKNFIFFIIFLRFQKMFVQILLNSEMRNFLIYGFLAKNFP